MTVKATDGRPSVVGRSVAVLRAMAQAERYAALSDPVLLLGPTGSGKGLLARLLHHLRGKAGRLVAVSGGQLVETLYQAELFGHVRGAYTGADRDVPGAFERARDGVLFLDELHLWSKAAQGAVLQAVEERWVLPLRGQREIPVTCRIVVGANRPLDRLVREGVLLEDLAYRIGDFVIELPPLAERRLDIAVLAFHFLEEARRDLPSACPLMFSAAALERLLQFNWPGNVRELRSAVRYACIEGSGRDEIQLTDLPPRFLDSKAKPPDRELLAEVTQWMYETVGRDRREAARRLRVHPNTVDNRLRARQRRVAS